MGNRVKDKVVIVTGGAMGIGWVMGLVAASVLLWSGRPRRGG